jgi:hypothetical protein
MSIEGQAASPTDTIQLTSQATVYSLSLMEAMLSFVVGDLISTAAKGL